jgi:Sigma-70, region 4
MCTTLSFDLYCKNFKCPHNLFCEELNLDREKIQMTDKTLEIRNCCCLIMHPWTLEEISEAWGLTREGIRHSEERAFKKLQKKIRINRKKPLSLSTLNRQVVV